MQVGETVDLEINDDEDTVNMDSEIKKDEDINTENSSINQQESSPQVVESVDEEMMLAPGRNRHSEAERKRQFRAIRKNQCTSFSFL